MVARSIWSKYLPIELVLIRIDFCLKCRFSANDPLRASFTTHAEELVMVSSWYYQHQL